MVEFIKGCNKSDCPDEINFYCDECGKWSDDLYKVETSYHLCKNCLKNWLFEYYSSDYKKLSDMDEMDLREEMENE